MYTVGMVTTGKTPKILLLKNQPIMTLSIKKYLAERPVLLSHLPRIGLTTSCSAALAVGASVFFANQLVLSMTLLLLGSLGLGWLYLSTSLQGIKINTIYAGLVVVSILITLTLCNTLDGLFAFSGLFFMLPSLIARGVYEFENRPPFIPEVSTIPDRLAAMQFGVLMESTTYVRFVINGIDDGDNQFSIGYSVDKKAALLMSPADLCGVLSYHFSNRHNQLNIPQRMMNIRWSFYQTRRWWAFWQGKRHYLAPNSSLLENGLRFRRTKVNGEPADILNLFVTPERIDHV